MRTWRFDLLMVKTGLKIKQLGIFWPKNTSFADGNLHSETDIPNHSSFCWCLPEWRGISASPNVSSRRETVCHFLALSELSCGHPGRNLPLYCATQNNPSSPNPTRCKIILQPPPSHSVFDWGCFSTGLTVSPAIPPVKVRKGFSFTLSFISNKG